MKLLLIYPSYFPGGMGHEFPSPPLAIYALAGIANQAGTEVEVVDPSHYGLRIRQRGVVEELIKECDAVGISATSLNWHEAFRLIKNIKEIDQKIEVIAGGVHATYFDRHILETCGANYVVRGEAEQSFPLLLKALDEKVEPSGIPGISYRSKSGKMVRNPRARTTGFKNWTPPLYEAIPDGVYKQFPLETSRGCPNSCFFCSVPLRQRWRPRDPTQVVQELERINRSFIRKTAGNTVIIVDDCFTASQAHVLKICKGIKESGITNGFVLEARITDLLKDPVMEAIAGLNLNTVQVGVECGYDEGLRKVNKTGLTVDKVIECAKRLRDHGIVDKVMFSFILGLPWEGIEECHRTLDFAEELVTRYGGYVNFSWWLLFPSDGWNERHAYGIDLNEELFDIQDWATMEELFLKTHPTLNQEAIGVIVKRVTELRQLILGSFLSSRTFKPSPESMGHPAGEWGVI